MDIDDERNQRPKFGLGRVVIVLALAWLAITVFGFVMDLVHRALVVAIVAVVVYVLVKVSRVTKKPRAKD
jgi:hypothetical protein